MKPYKELSREELLELQKQLQAEYEEEKAKGLNLDISRGKPSKAQLDLSMSMLDVLNSGSDLSAEDGTDVRNYGGLEGIPEARKLMGDVMEVDPSQVIVFGNSSLNIMYGIHTFDKESINDMMKETGCDSVEEFERKISMKILFKKIKG